MFAAADLDDRRAGHGAPEGLARADSIRCYFFLLEKLGAVVGTTNLHIYAAMRGQSLEDFQKTRNAQVLYSVAGQDEGKKDWDKQPGDGPLVRLRQAGAHCGCARLGLRAPCAPPPRARRRRRFGRCPGRGSTGMSANSLGCWRMRSIRVEMGGGLRESGSSGGGRRIALDELVARAALEDHRRVTSRLYSDGRFCSRKRFTHFRPRASNSASSRTALDLRKQVGEKM